MGMNNKSPRPLFFCVFLFLVSQCFLSGCAHKKIAQSVTLDSLQNKRVALAEVKGSAESRSHVEVAVINEIIDQGRFQIVDRTSVQEALATYPTESDWQGLGKKVGADYVLGIRIVDFSVKERQGYDKVQEEDPVLEEESGEHKKIIGTRYEKVKSNTGSVKLSCSFFDVRTNAITYQGIGAAEETSNSRDKDFATTMKLLEKLSRRAISDFFERIPK